MKPTKPSGWKWVPVVATPDMRAIARRHGIGGGAFLELWSELLAAAPNPFPLMGGSTTEEKPKPSTIRPPALAVDQLLHLGRRS